MSRRIDQTEIDDLKSRTELSSVFAQFGVRSRDTGKIKWVPCCFHGEKTPSLKIDDTRGRYHCFGCGASGDHFSVLTELGGKTFMEAVEVLGGVRLITAEERKEIEAQSQKWQKEEAAKSDRTRKDCQKLFDGAKPIGGTLAAAYLEARGLPVVKHLTADLRFVAELPYHGWVSAEADSTSDLGAFPAMVAAIRDAKGQLIGLHRTYLDKSAPKKLVPPGDPARNKAKKVLGEQKGGTIRLSPEGPCVVIGEGIETTRAWFALGLAEEDVALAAAVSLGNLSGGAMGSSPHPTDDDKRIPNGIPDMDRPGMILPAIVRKAILLGDGDSDWAMTRARLLVGGRRLRNLGLSVWVQMAPKGQDFGDLVEGA